MINILVLSCGTNASYHFIKTIKEKFPNDFKIIGTDINEKYLVSTANLLDKFYNVPYIGEANYYQTIIDICKNNDINVILPSFDKDQELFNNSNNDLKSLGIFSLGTPSETLSIYLNKNNMNTFLKEHGFNIPKQYDAVSSDDEKYFVKPNNGVGSIGAKIQTGLEINSLDNKTEYVIQEICENPEITLECFYYNGHLSTVARERIETKSGVCTKTKVYHSKILENIASDFVKIINTPYFFNIQFMKNSQGEFVITDINFRLAGGMSLCYAAGWDEVSAIAKILLRKKEEDIFATLGNIKGSKWVVRAYSDILTKQEKPVAAFDLDGTLLDSRKRHEIVLKDILNKFDINIEISDLIEFKSKGKNNVEYLVNKGLSEEIAKKIQTDWITNIEKEDYLTLDTLYDDSIDLLESSLKDYNLILITARNNKDGLFKQLEALKIKDYFSDIFVVSADKNAAENKYRILVEQNAEFFIGDTKSDYLAAKLANVDFKFRENGFHNSQYVMGEQ